MSHPRIVLASVALSLVAALAGLAGCQKDNPGFCGTDCPIDADDIDAVQGCLDNPGLCSADETCLADVCVDCESGDDHQSAQCTDPLTPVCAADRDCRACAADSECDSNLCDHGSCAEAGKVLFVRPDGDPAAGNACTDSANPCKTVTQAIAKVPATGGAPTANRRFIKLMTAATYLEPGIVSIDGKTIVIIGAPVAPGSRSVIDRLTMGQTMEIKGQADVRLERVGVNDATGNPVTGLECKESSKLVADGIEVTGNTGVGIDAVTCQLTLVNSYVATSLAGGVSIRGGRAVVVNNVITGSGTSGIAGSDFGGLLVNAAVATDSVIQSNTILSNHAADAKTDGIDCSVAAITLRNHILIGDATKPRVLGTCGYANILFGPDDPGSRLTAAPGALLVANTADLQFVNPALRDYHIKSTSVAKGKGTSTGLAAEAMKDVDGEPRPQGAADVGVDEIAD